MAHVFGEAGRYVCHEASRKRRSIRLLTLLVVAGLSFIEGLVVCFWVLNGNLPPWVFLAMVTLFLPALWALNRWSNRKLNVLEREQVNLNRGATGEQTVADLLSELPESFHVINDLTTDCGNLDHVVVGPTGVFMVETKAWRGEVAAGGFGELTLNGRPTDKPLVKQFLGRAMGIREKVMLLAQMEFGFQALFVFTSARVKARWGTTGSAHCIRDDQLWHYVVHRKGQARLSHEQVARIAQAFLALAHMDINFDSRQDQAQPVKLAACY